jgi:ABC-type Co2+ transport system permease subunit
MSHIHIPDGVLPAWLTAGGWLFALAVVWIASAVARRGDVRRKVPLLGVVSALVLVSMSSEIVPLAYHINLTVVAGALLGPWLGVIAAFIVEVVLALLGHGGVTVIGLNTLMIAGEMVLGWALFTLFVRALGRSRVGWATGVATVLTLAVTTAALVGVVALAGGGAAASRETGALDPAHLEFADPFGDGVFAVNTLRGEGSTGGGTSATGSATGSGTGLPVARFAAVVFTLGPIGWLIEALVQAGVLSYVARVRPSLIFGGAPARRALPSHEGAH